jgi:hypothetical protein
VCVSLSHSLPPPPPPTHTHTHTLTHTHKHTQPPPFRCQVDPEYSMGALLLATTTATAALLHGQTTTTLDADLHARLNLPFRLGPSQANEEEAGALVEERAVNVLLWVIAELIHRREFPGPSLRRSVPVLGEEGVKGLEERVDALWQLVVAYASLDATQQQLTAPSSPFSPGLNATYFSTAHTSLTLSAFARASLAVRQAAQTTLRQLLQEVQAASAPSGGLAAALQQLTSDAKQARQQALLTDRQHIATDVDAFRRFEQF